jgi:glycosyltransferase involved in cell wall biosynthesis
MTERTVELSIVVPVYNEVESVPELYAALTESLLPYADRYELIFVDDGSSDGSFERLQAIWREDKRVRVVRLRRNCGKAAALTAGFREVRGGIVVTLDADLQDDPKEIPRFLQGIAEGYDLVSGWKTPRNDPWSRRVLSGLFNRVTSLLTGVGLHDLNCGFKGYRRAVIEEIKVHGELHRFIPVLASWKGFRIGEIQVAHHPRRYGQSKYGAERIPRGFFDLLTVLMLTRYTARPLHLFGLLGLLVGLAGLGIVAYLSIGWLFGKWIGARPLLVLGALMVVAGLQLVLFGLLAEMIVYASKPDGDPPIDSVLG